VNYHQYQKEKSVSVRIPAATVFKVLMITALVGGLAYLLILLSSLLLTVSVAAFLAIAADPGVRFVEQKLRLGRGAAVAAVMLGLTVLLAVAIAVFVPPLVTQGQKLVAAAPGAVNKVRHNAQIRKIDQRYHVVDKASKQAESLPGKVSKQLGSVVGAVLAGLVGSFTMMFLMVLFLLGGGQLTSSIAQVVPQLAERRWWSIVQDSYRSIGAYVAGTLLIAVIAGVAMLAALLALQLPFALPLALWMALLDIVPLIGATIGAVPALIVAFAAGGVVDGIINAGLHRRLPADRERGHPASDSRAHRCAATR